MLEPGECADPEIVVDATVGEPPGRKLPLPDAQVGRTDLDRWEEAREGGRGADDLRDASQLARDKLELGRTKARALSYVEPLTVEDG